MRTWFTADPHFGHARIIELCNRPFSSCDDMNKALLEGINSRVGTDERLVILGDVLLGNFEANRWLLAGIRAAQVILVPGNHDRWSLAYHHKGEVEVVAAKRLDFAARYAVTPNVLLVEDRSPSMFLWNEITGETSSGHPLENALFSHYPYDGDSHDEDRYASLRPVRRGLGPPNPLVHGHVHGNWREKGRMFNVGVDVNDFAPVSEDELVSWMESLPAKG